jgi:hypothetical protein
MVRVTKRVCENIAQSFVQDFFVKFFVTSFFKWPTESLCATNGDEKEKRLERYTYLH